MGHWKPVLRSSFIFSFFIWFTIFLIFSFYSIYHNSVEFIPYFLESNFSVGLSNFGVSLYLIIFQCRFSFPFFKIVWKIWFLRLYLGGTLIEVHWLIVSLNLGLYSHLGMLVLFEYPHPTIFWVFLLVNFTKFLC